MVDVPHVGEWKYSFRYSRRATSIHCLFLMKPIVSTVTTEECETPQPSELGMCTTPSFLMYYYHSVDYKVTTFSHFLSIYFLSNVFYLSFLDTIVFYASFFRISFLYLGARVETGSCRSHSLTLSMPLSPPHKRACREDKRWSLSTICFTMFLGITSYWR